MITKTGKTIIAKLFGNQLDSAFSFMALGVGPRPQYPQSPPIVSANKENGFWHTELDDGSNGKGFIAKESLSLSNNNELFFEVLRLPIRESSVVFENGETKLCLNAVVPTPNRFEFSEIGVFPADSNAFLMSKPSSLIFSFASGKEAWQTWGKKQNDKGEWELSGELEPVTYESFADTDGVYFRKATDVAWYVNKNSDDDYDNYSTVRISEWGLVMSTGTQIVNSEPAVDLTNSLPQDELRFAFSYRGFNLNNPDSAAVKSKWKITLKFVDNNNISATMVFDRSHLIALPTEDDDVEAEQNILSPTSYTKQWDNGYAVVTQAKNKFVYSDDNVVSDASDPDGTAPPLRSTDLNFGAIDKVVIDFDVDDAEYPNAQICLDGMRFETKNYNNPAYGLVAHSVVQNNLDDEGNPAVGDDNRPAIGKPQLFVKKDNTETIIEYKILLDNGDTKDVREDDA